MSSFVMLGSLPAGGGAGYSSGNIGLLRKSPKGVVL